MRCRPWVRMRPNGDGALSDVTVSGTASSRKVHDLTEESEW